MKFGVVLHKTTMNMGDDIQTYAAMQHLPQVDYVIERENPSKFCSENNEPVAVIMSAWWMWQKWNWPPAECIVPKLTSMHINNYSIYRRSSPITDEWLQGVGGQFFRENGPIGVRDLVSLEFFKERGFDSYFSGCITLTLPKQKKTEDAGKYVCLVDLHEAHEAAARELLKDTDLEIRVLSHRCDYRNSEATFEERMQKVEELLTQYQNAKYVITRRLHVTLPCLAMGVPVISVVDMKDEGNTTRWTPYKDWLYFATEEEFEAGELNFEFDFQNPPANKTDYLETRKKLTAELTTFVDEMKNCTLPLEEVKKTTYTKEEAYRWQHELMNITLEKWLHQNRGLLKQKDSAKEKVKELSRELKQANKKLKKAEDVLNADGLFIRAVRKIKRLTRG